MASHSPARLLAGVAAGVALALAGCANVPTAGPVQVVRERSQAAGITAPDLTVLAQQPQPGQSPRDIVRGFLEAVADFGDHYGVARSFLSPAAAVRWTSSSGVQVYDATDLAVSGPVRGVVTVTAPRTAVVDAAGDYQPATGSLQARFVVQRVRGQWRIAGLPAGLLLSAADFEHTYRPVDLYYLDPIADLLVPDPVFLQARLPNLPTAVVAALLSGPSPAVLGTVRTAAPAGLALSGPVTISGATVTVPLNRAVAGLTTARYRNFTAQLCWTLAAFGVAQVQLQPPPGSALPGPSLVSLATLASYNPDVLRGTPPPYLLTASGVRRLGAHPMLLAGSAGLLDPAISADGRLLAGVRSTAGGQTVVAGTPGGTLNPVTPLEPGMLSPAFAADDALWVLVDLRLGRQELWRIPPHSPVQVVDVPDLAGLGPATGFAVSRDGTRIALSTADGLYVGGVDYTSGGPQVANLLSLLPSVDTPESPPVWQDAQTVAVLADVPENGSPGGLVEPLFVSVDGASLGTMNVAGLPLPGQIAAGPGEPVLLLAGSTVYQATAAGWTELATHAQDIVYPGG